MTHPEFSPQFEHKDQSAVLEGCQTLPPMKSHAAESCGAKTQPARQRKQSDRWQVLNSFVDHSLGSLSRSEIAVWFVLYRDTRDGVARASQKYIAGRAGVSDRTVRRVIESLVKKQLLRVIQQGGINRGASTYRVLREPEG